MRYQGNYPEDATVDFKFHTHKEDGTPLTLAGSPALAVYKANGITESTAGITLSVDFDGVTGMHHVRIDTSADAFYAIANDYQVILTSGTVDGKSVVGYVVGEFSIQNRFGTSQQVRDAMKLAPSGGAPAAGSVDTHLDDTQTKTDQLAFSSANKVDANMKAIDENPTNNNSATLKLKELHIINSSGEAIHAEAGGSAHAVHFIGKDGGEGIRSEGGDNGGSGIYAKGGNNSGAGITAVAPSGDGIHSQGSSDGIYAFSAGNGHGMHIKGLGNGDGIHTEGAGTGDGINAIKGATGKDINADEIDAIKAKTDNLPEGIKKNAVLNNFEFLMIDSSDHISPKTGLTVTATRSIDGAAFGAAANLVSELSNGIYKINLAAADLNGSIITLRFTAPGADDRLITIKTNI